MGHQMQCNTSTQRKYQQKTLTRLQKVRGTFMEATVLLGGKQRLWHVLYGLPPLCSYVHVICLTLTAAVSTGDTQISV